MRLLTDFSLANEARRKGSRWAIAGLEPGNIVLTFDGKAVTDMRHQLRLVAETPVDKAEARCRRRHR